MKLECAREWYTAAELAELALPGLPRTKRKVNERAAGEAWALRTAANGAPLARARPGRGGGFEYHADVLPGAARAALAARGVTAVADVSAMPQTSAGSLWRWFESASAATRAAATRRLSTVDLVQSYERAGLTRSAAVAAAAARDGVGSSTLWGWLELIRGVAPADRLAHLAPRRAGGGAETAIDAAAWQFLISDYLRPEKPTFTACYARMAKTFPALTLPLERTLRRRFEREIPPQLVIARRMGADELRRSIPAQERSVMELHAMEAVNIDGHKFDVFVQWDDGRIGRPMMVAVQDVYSRKIVAHRIDESENALATRLVFADLFRDWGIPKHCLLDNGRAFASKTITGGAKTRFRFKIKDEEPTGVLTALGIEIHWATPYRGQSKPIERAFRDLCDTIAKHPALAGAYTGNTPLAKPENYGSKAIPIAVFRDVVARGIAAHNAKPNRRTETAQGVRSFDDVFAASYASAPIGKATPEQLRLALLTAEDRMCDRQTAVVTLEGNRYYADALADHAGQKLTVRFDPDDLHGEVHVYDRQGRFVATAPVIDKSGFFDKAAAGKRKAQEANLRRMVREQERAADLLDAATLAAMMPDYSDEEPRPEARVVRAVRHRGQTKGALALADIAVAEPQAAPINSVIDRLGAGLRLVG